jgi:periplasmic protein TonB
MSTLLEGDEQLERELTGEPVVAPATGSIVLHAALALAIVLYYIIGGFFHSNIWGGSAAGGAIRVNLVSSALPLPADQPPNQNVLATDKPSPAPALPLPKAAPVIDEKAIPILGKHEKEKPQHAPKTPPKQPPPKQENRAQYGEQSGSSIPRAITGQTTTVGPTSINEGDFGSRFPWYVDAINRKMSQTWNKGEVDARTPKGARVFLVFSLDKYGRVTGDVQLDRSSGSPTLDRSCIRAVQRVDGFGNLPGGYTSNTLKVSYYCEY